MSRDRYLMKYNVPRVGTSRLCYCKNTYTKDCKCDKYPHWEQGIGQIEASFPSLISLDAMWGRGVTEGTAIFDTFNTGYNVRFQFSSEPQFGELLYEEVVQMTSTTLQASFDDVLANGYLRVRVESNNIIGDYTVVEY